MGIKLELPKIEKDTDGLSMFRGKWHLITYKNSKVSRSNLGTKDLREAMAIRDAKHVELIEEGATYTGNVGRKKLTIDPTNDAGIYCSYRIVIEGVWVGSSTNLEDARRIRDEYIKEHS